MNDRTWSFAPAKSFLYFCLQFKLLLKAGLLFFFILVSTSLTFAQQESRAYGIGGVYDFQTNGLGLGVRAYIPITDRFAVSPQLAWFPPFNKIHEVYVGAAAQYAIYFMTSWHFYALGAVYYDRWQNAGDFHGKIAKVNNIAEEGGVGIMRTFGCLKPFFEARYDVKWKEANVQAGIMISFGDCFQPHLCPAY